MTASIRLTITALAQRRTPFREWRARQIQATFDTSE